MQTEPIITTLICMAFLLVNTSLAFNIEGGTKCFAHSPATSNSFFGYQFSVAQPLAPGSDDIKLILGAPYASQQQQTGEKTPMSSNFPLPERLSSGDIFSCSVKLLSPYQSCTSVMPERPNRSANPDVITERDGFGLTLASPRSSKILAACAPFRARRCSDSFFTHGACYRSPDFGSNWGATPRSISSKMDPECDTKLDLVFLLDGSASVSNNDFQKVLEWLIAVSSRFDVSGTTNIGVIQYSHYYMDIDDPVEASQFLETEIAIGKIKDFSNFTAAVHQIQRHGYTTYTAHAINKTVEDFKNSSRFGDSTTTKIMILLTDGRSNDVDYLEASAHYARSFGIIIFAVGVASFAEEELKVITGNHADMDENENIFGLGNFDQLVTTVTALQESMTEVMKFPDGSTSRNLTNGLQQPHVGLSAAYSNVR
ncbi:unnamed protein product [Clavelina lepadiformis]|uniref:VWFA domain-containing protein n=1 Tax=Clavelina lepadiformis TaxID=159417 RepID=A0ABP0G9P8_CLALP